MPTLDQEQPIESALPPQFNIKSPLDPSKLNVAGVGEDPDITEHYQKAIDATNEMQKTLQERYEQPNYFKLAAAFAKPQLGGFIASLGSAADVLGQQTEAQRAIQPTIARMKAEIEAGMFNLAQHTKQKQLYNDWLKTGRPMDPQTAAEIYKYDPTSSYGVTAKGYMDDALKTIQAQTGSLNLAANNPLANVQNIVDFSLTPNADPKENERQRNASLSALSQAKPAYIDQATWDGMTPGNKAVAVANWGAKQNELGMDERTKLWNRTKDADVNLASLADIRDLALGVGLKDYNGKTGQQQMDSMLGFLGTSGNPIDQLLKAIADGKLVDEGGKIKGLDQYARSVGASPDAIDHMQKLIKLLATNQSMMRNATANPTDTYGDLAAQASPSIANSQRALVGIVDLMAHNMKYDQEKWKFMTSHPGISYDGIGKSVDFAPIADRFLNEHRQIATQTDPLKNLPTWYKLQRHIDETPASSANPAAPAAPTTPPSSAAPTTPKKVERKPTRTLGGVTYYLWPDGEYRTNKPE